MSEEKIEALAGQVADAVIGMRRKTILDFLEWCYDRKIVLADYRPDMPGFVDEDEQLPYLVDGYIEEMGWKT